MSTAARRDAVVREIEPQILERSTGIGRGWLIRRLLFGVFTLWLASTIVFAATQALPSDPARTILGRAPEPAIKLLRKDLELDRSVPAQYVSWLGRVVQADLGDSLASRSTEANTSEVARQRVTSLIGPRLRNSLVLLALTAVIAIPIGIALGFSAAMRRGRAGDNALLGASIVLTALPEFVIGLILVIIFSTTVFSILPAVSVPGENPLAHSDVLVLPVATLMLVSAPYVFRLARASMIEVLASDYVAMARLKGMPERRVVWRHAARNALIAPLQGSAVILAYLLGGVVVVETLFSYPGLGTALVEAVKVQDMPMIQGIVIVFAAGIVLFNIVADALTVYLTPRLRTAVR